MAEVLGIMVRREPRQVFTILVSWNLSALWKRIKSLQWPWTPYNQPAKREFPRDTTTKVPRHTEEYLRPTTGDWGANPYEPEVVALAVKLGMKEKSKREYAKAAYDWVKNNICFYMEVPPRGVLETLKKGYGLCLNKIIVFIALMRVAEIPARFVGYKQEMGGGFLELMLDETTGHTGKDIVQYLEDSRPSFMHGSAEAFLDGEWIAADLTWTDEEEAGFDLPISQFGDSPFGKWYNIIPESVTRHEVIFAPVGLMMAFGMIFLRGLYDKMNGRFDRVREIGRERLQKMGRDGYSASKKKFYVPPPPLISEDEATKDLS
jgi:hypothetical protein